MRTTSIDVGSAAVAVLLGLIAGVILWQAQAFTSFAAIFPRAVGIALLICSLLVLWRSVRRTAAEPVTVSREGLLRSALLVLVVLAWVALLEPLGFLFASWLGFFLLALLANRDPVGPKRLLVFAGVALGCVLALQLLFQRGLDVRLPAGVWLPNFFS